MDRLESLRIRQVDVALKPFNALKQHHPPKSGWVSTIRNALGMSIRQLGERAGFSKTSVASAEKSEAKGTVQMDTLKRLADGLNCDLVHALVPRASSLDELIKQQAHKKAKVLIGRVSDSMELEDQAVSEEERTKQLQDLVEDILGNRKSDFWDD